MKSKRVTSLVAFGSRTNHKQTVAQKIHFMTRFRERVGYRLSESAYADLLNHVKSTGKFLFRRENELGAVYGVVFNNSRMKVVYDAFSHTLITVLPFK